MDLNGESYGAPFDGFVELAPGVYTLDGADSYGDGWNGAEMTVDASSGVDQLLGQRLCRFHRG